MATKGSHLRALLRKNFILFRRNKCCSVLEIMIPIIMVCFMILFRALVDATDVPEKSYLTDKKTFHPEPSVATADPVQNFTIIQNCKTRKDPWGELPSYRNGHIALISNNLEMRYKLEQHFAEITYTTKNYSSLAELHAYIRSEDYLEDVCIGIDINEDLGNQKWTYRLIYNISKSDDYKMTDLPYKDWQQQVAYNYERMDYNYHLWVRSGFMSLLTWIDNLILKAQAVPTASI